MPVLPHQDGTTVSPRGLSVEQIMQHCHFLCALFCITLYLVHRSINPLSVMTCNSVAAVPEDPSVPSLMLKVSLLIHLFAHISKLIHSAASEYVTCRISSFHFQNRLFQTNLPSPRRAPRLRLDSPIHSQPRRHRAPADSAWCPGLRAPRLQIPSRTAQGRMEQNRGCWETSCLSVRT